MSVGSALTADLAIRFKQKKALIGVIGLGYVGLPLCLALAESGSRVLGFDIDAAKAEAIARGASYIKHIADEKIAELAAAGRLQATADFSLLSKPDALLICVPTPLTRHLEPDLSFVISTGQQIARHLRRGQLVVLESTTYPGTTEQVLRPILEESGLKAGRDFFLAFSPEREDPGNTDFSAARLPKVVGGDSQEARDLAVING